jgi:hypothetical protein
LCRSKERRGGSGRTFLTDGEAIAGGAFDAAQLFHGGGTLTAEFEVSRFPVFGLKTLADLFEQLFATSCVLLFQSLLVSFFHTMHVFASSLLAGTSRVFASGHAQTTPQSYHHDPTHHSLLAPRVQTASQAFSPISLLPQCGIASHGKQPLFLGMSQHSVRGGKTKTYTGVREFSGEK